MKDDPRTLVHRKTGKLEKFEPKKFEGFVRLGKHKLHVTTSARGELKESGLIAGGINGHRFDPIKPGTLIVLDLTYDLEGNNPMVSAWAPKK